MKSNNFLDLMEAGSLEPKPSDALRLAFKKCVRLTGSSAGVLFQLNQSTACYEPICLHGKSIGLTVQAEVLNRKRSPVNDLERSIVFRETVVLSDLVGKQCFSATSQSALLVPITRGAAVVGLIVLESESPNHYNDDHINLAMCTCLLCLLLFEKKQSIDLMEALHHPIEYHTSRIHFVSELLALIALASGMPFIVLREYLTESDSLHCLASYGFSEEMQNSNLDIDDLKSFPSFEHVVRSGKSKNEPDTSAPHLVNLMSRPEQQKVKSFVVSPVKVGSELFGTLSFGSRVRYEFTRLEETGFETIANAIGVSLSNYINYHKKNLDIAERIKISTTITAVEVAQAARHQARHHLETAINHVELLDLIAEKPTRDNLSQISETVSKLQLELENVDFALNRIRDVTKPPSRSKEIRVINEIWREAFSVVQGRLLSESIDHDVVGKNVEASVYPDFLMHAFLNLILNSIDAFREFGKKRNRSILVSIEQPSDSVSSIRMRYSDNASGIDVSTLYDVATDSYQSGQTANSLDLNDIFRAGVTSKKEGSGYGLFLVRSIISEHKGSINLMSHRNGVGFVISLPKSGRSK